MSSVQERLDRMINGTGTASSGAGSSVMERLDRMINHSLPQAANKDDEDSAARWPSQSKESTKDLLPSFATPSGGGKSVENILGKFSGRGGVEAIKSPDSWSSTGDAELGLKAWSGQLESYEKKLTELSGSIANTENRLKNLQTTVKTAEDAAAYDELYAGYEKMIADYNGVVNDINRVQDKYSAGVERYRDILSGGMERADAAAAEAKRLEDENSRLQRQANLIRIYEMSGTSPSSAAAPIEAQIEQNARRIKELRAEESQNKMQYYSSLALMEDYADLSAPGKVTGDSRYDYINDIDSARYRNEHTTDPSGAPVALRRYQYLTEDEIKIYNYLYASQGKDAADRFLEDMGPALTERQGAAQYEELGALGKALYWIPAGLDQFGSGIRQLFQREAVPVSSTQITSQLIQQEAQEKSPVLGTLYTLGTTLSNMAPSILASALGSWALGAAGLSAGTASAIGRAAGGTALGASAGGNAYTQKLNEGYSSEAAQNYATLVGASEGALQYLLGGIGALSKSGTGRIAAKIAGLDNALGRVARTVSGSTAARLLGSMISEGTEEGLQELLEPAFAAIIFDEEYEADFEDAAYAFLLGALSAGIIEGPAAIAYARRPAGFSFRDMDGYADNGVDYFEGANTLEEVEARYRDLARQYHPDVGGDTAIMAEINRQRTMARAFFRGRAEAAAEDNTADTTPEAAANTERADGVTRRLTAGRTTEENTPETAGAPIEDQIYSEAGGIVLPTADTAGDFSPRAETGATETPTLEAPRAAAPETNAAGNIVLPTADEIMNGGISNGQQGQQWQQRRNQVSDGDGGRFSGQRAGVEAGELARGAEQAARPTQQVGTALARQARVRGLRLERVSSASLGLENGTEARSLQVIPEAAYDDELRAVSADVYRRTGQRVTFVAGNIQVRAVGKTRAVRGVWTPGGIYVQADNAGYSAAQIAAHEVYHDLAANTPGLDADVKQRIIERYGEDEFRRVAQVYIERLRGVYDVPDGAEYDPALMDTYFGSILQEIYADAYAGINAFGAHAERFADAARVTVAERTGMATGETEAATRNRTGPPAERNGVGYITEEKETTAVKAKNPSPGTDSSTATVSTSSVAENALPVKEGEKRTNTWLQGVRLQLPSYDTMYGPIGSISYDDDYVNIHGAPWNELADSESDAGESVNNRYSEDEPERYSVDEEYAAELELWNRDGRPGGEVFVLGSTGEALQGLGAMEQDIYLRSEKINAILDAHPEMTLSEIKRIPEILDDPVLIAKSAGEGRGGRNSRLTIMGSLRAQNGKPIMAVLDLRPIEGRLLVNDMQKINSAYTRSNAANYLRRSEILFADEKRTIPLLRSAGLTIASQRLLRHGSMGSITYSGNDVNIEGVPFDEVVGAAQPERYSVDETTDKEVVPDYFRGNPYWLETEHAAKAAGYPEIDGVQIMPYKTWVRSKEQGNYGFVVGLAPRDRLVVSFWNKDSGKRAVVPLEQTDIEPVQGAYQMEQNELASLLESEPEAVERMELSPEDEAEYQRWLTEKYGFKAGVRANTTLLALPKKAQTEYKRSVSRLVNDLGKSLGVPYHAGRSELRPIAEQIADEYFREGTVSEESGAELFEEAYANGIIRDDEFYRENKPILDYLRTTPIRVSETVKSDIADFNDWRKRQFGRLRISEDGRGLEQVYGELSEMAPRFFPEDITNPTDQLERIADVADSIRISERTLDEYYGPDAAEYKRWAYDEFKQQIGRAYESLRTVRQIALEQDAKRAELKRLLEIAETGPTEGELDRVKRLWDEGKKARRAYERAVRRNLLSDRDRQLLGQLMRGEISAEDIPSTANRAGIAEIYAAKREYEAFAGALKEFNTKRRAALRAQADDILAGASRMKDKRRGASYMRETQERNARYVFDGPTAEKIIETYFTPVHKNEARRTVYKTQLRDRVRELDLDRKARKGDAVSEAAAVQIYGEALDNISMIEEQLKRGGSDWRNGHSLSEWRALVDDLWAKSPGLDKEKITAAVEEFRKIYDELFSLMNQVRIRNGYEPVDYRHGYFPHFDDAKGESLLGRAFEAADMKDVPLKDRLAALVGKGLDVNTEVNALPTSISGLTHTFKPGIRWVGNIMQRQGFDTTFDAVQGFDRYIEGVSDVIYHTDDIQRLRALASQIRYRTSEPGIQAQVDEIRADSRLTEEQKDEAVRKKQEEGRYELSNYVNNIEEYTNLLANKRSAADRGIEFFAGRDFYNFSKALENRVAANMVAVNPGSWLTNFIPISQAWAEVSAGDILTSMRDTLSAMVKDDGFRTKSDFLTNRMGSDPLVLSWTQDASKILTKPMEWIDMFTSETVVRARYNSNLKLGMSETAAMEEADSFAAGLIADRSKGALPTIFESRNPFTKLFTQFQVEVNNQLSYLYRDLPRNLKERGKKSLAVALLKFMLGAWLYDELYEAIVGRRPALDPLNMLNELSGDLFGYALPNTIELAVDMITGNDVSLATERTDAATALANFGKELGGQLPFIGGPVFDGGRLPIQSAIKDPLAYLLLPFGGGQISKFIKGVNAVAEGGVYGKDAEGNPTLKYPVERNVQDALTAMVFGATSTKGGQDWIDRGFSRLTAKQTAAYAALLGGGVDAYDAFDVVMDIKGTEKTETQSANDIKREKISALDISDELKATLYSNLITDDYDEAIDDMLRRSVDWDGIMGVVTNSKYGVERYNKLVDAGVSPGNAARITEALYSLEPEDGKKSVSQVQQYGAIDKLDGLTDEEKLAAIGTIMGTDATTESGNPSQYSKLTDAIESGLSLTDALEQRENGTLDDYLEFYSAGMKSDAAVDAAETLDAMPEDASTVERYLAIAEMPLSERDKDAALSAIMSDSAYEKYQAARSKGIDTYEYVAFLRAISDFSGDGKQQRVWDYINSLPLSTAQKDQLHYAAGYKESSLAKTPWH